MSDAGGGKDKNADGDVGGDRDGGAVNPDTTTAGDGKSAAEGKAQIPPAEPLPTLEDGDPGPSDRSTEPEGAFRRKIAASKVELTRNETGVDASTLAPEAAAGVKLAKYVLAIVAGTIVLLLAHLFWTAGSARDGIAKVNEQVYLQMRGASAAVDLARLDSMIAALEAGAAATTAAPVSLAADMEMLASALVAAKVATERQKVTLAACVPFPSTDRPLQLGDCADLLRTMRSAAAAAGANLDKIRVITEFAKTVDEQNRGYQAFWLQVAQLLLLNLLLPLLTGLFGYIFGTQGARRG